MSLVWNGQTIAGLALNGSAVSACYNGQVVWPDSPTPPTPTGYTADPVAFSYKSTTAMYSAYWMYYPSSVSSCNHVSVSSLVDFEILATGTNPRVQFIIKSGYFTANGAVTTAKLSATGTLTSATVNFPSTPPQQSYSGISYDGPISLTAASALPNHTGFVIYYSARATRCSIESAPTESSDFSMAVYQQ